MGAEVMAVGEEAVGPRLLYPQVLQRSQVIPR